MNLALELLLSAAGMILGIVLIAEAVWQAQNSWENETDGPDGCLDAGSGGLRDSLLSVLGLLPPKDYRWSRSRGYQPAWLSITRFASKSRLRVCRSIA